MAPEKYGIENKISTLVSLNKSNSTCRSFADKQYVTALRSEGFSNVSG